MKTFTVKVKTSKGITTYNALAYSSSACIRHALNNFTDALGVSAILCNQVASDAK